MKSSLISSFTVATLLVVGHAPAYGFDVHGSAQPGLVETELPSQYDTPVELQSDQKTTQSPSPNSFSRRNASAGGIDIHGTPQPDLIDNPVPSRFSVCFQHTCAQVAHVALSQTQWQGVQDFFKTPAKSAEDERSQIASAIAYLEVEVGQQINSLDDRGGNLEGFVASGNQLDCVDESTNSTTYMIMMENDDLLKFHTVSKKATRGFMIMGWPHTTAVIQEKATGQKWVVDSWFFDNGKKPTIAKLDKWRTGWSPEGAKH